MRENIPFCGCGDECGFMKQRNEKEQKPLGLHDNIELSNSSL